MLMHGEQNPSLSYLPTLDSGGVELAEIPNGGRASHGPAYRVNGRDRDGPWRVRHVGHAKYATVQSARVEWRNMQVIHESPGSGVGSRRSRSAPCARRAVTRVSPGWPTARRAVRRVRERGPGQESEPGRCWPAPRRARRDHRGADPSASRSGTRRRPTGPRSTRRCNGRFPRAGRPRRRRRARSGGHSGRPGLRPRFRARSRAPRGRSSESGGKGRSRRARRPTSRARRTAPGERVGVECHLARASAN